MKLGWIVPLLVSSVFTDRTVVTSPGAIPFSHLAHTVVLDRTQLRTPPPPLGARIPPSAHSFYHHQRFLEQSIYHQDYAQFCATEEQVARIVYAYAKDPQIAWCVVIPPEFLYTDSVRSYGRPSEVRRIYWITPSIHVGVPDAVFLPTLRPGALT